MDHKELDAIEALFLNPPSASLPAELGLKLVAALRKLLGPVSLPVAHEASPAAIIPPFDPPELAAPTPPSGPAAKKKAAHK